MQNMLILGLVEKLQQGVYLFDITIYRFIGTVYDFLMGLAQMQIFDSAEINEFARRLYALIAIIMLFRATFILLNIVINPEKAFHEKEGTATSIAGKIVTTLVLILIVPYIFSFAYDLQSAVLRENIIGRIISGKGGYEKPIVNLGYKCTFIKFRELRKDGVRYTLPDKVTYDLSIPADQNYLSYYNESGDEVKVKFKRVKNRTIENNVYNCREYALIDIYTPLFGSTKGEIWFSDEKDRGGVRREANYQRVEGSVELGSGSYELTTGRIYATQLFGEFISFNEPETQSDFDEAISVGNIDLMQKNGLKAIDDKELDHYYIGLSTAAGILLLLLLLSSCFDIAVRAIKLGFLELTAPAAIATYMQGGKDPSTTFKNWVRVCITTYADIFIRVLVLSFFSFGMDKILEEGFMDKILYNSDGEALFSANLMSNDWIVKFLIVFALLMFVKTAPQLVGDIIGVNFSGSGNMFELNPLKKLQEAPGIGVGIGLGAGAVGGLVGGAATAKGGFLNRTWGGLRGTFTGGFKGAQKVPLGGFGARDRVPFNQTLTPVTAGKTGFKRAEAGNLVSSAKGERRQARKVQDKATSAYDTASNARTTAETGMIEARSKRDTYRSMNEQLEPQHDSLFKKYNEADQRYITASSNVSQLNNQLQDVRDRKQVINQNLGSLIDQRTQTIEEFKQARSNPNFASDNRDYIQEIDQLTAYIDSEAEKINKLSVEERELMSDLAIAEKEVEDAKVDREEVLPDLVDISHEMAINEDEALEAEKSATRYEQSMQQVEKEMERQQQVLEQARKKEEETEAEIKAFKGQRKKIE